MKRINFYFILIVISVIPYKTYSQQEIIQNTETASLLIIAPNGYRVYLDEEFIGFTSDDHDGYFIEQINLGFHEILLKKQNKDDFYEVVAIKEAKNYEVNFSENHSEILTTGVYKVQIETIRQGLFSTRKDLGYKFLIFDDTHMHYVLDVWGELKNASRKTLLSIDVNNDDFQHFTATYSISGNKIHVTQINDINEGNKAVLEILDKYNISLGQLKYTWTEQ